MNVNPYSL